MSEPLRTTYLRTIDRIVKAMQKDHSDVCFYGYGTLWEDGGRRFNPTSDIDGGFIFPGKPNLNNAKVYELGRILEEQTREQEIDLEFNLLDERSSLDGRFLSYTPDFTEHISANGVILSGPDMRNCLKGLNYKSGPLNSAAMNLRSMRNDYLQSLIHKRDPQELYDITVRAIKKAVKFPKKLWLARTGELVLSSKEACRKLEEATESAFPYAWEQMHTMIQEGDTNRLRDPSSALNWLAYARETSERIAYDYLLKFKDHNDHEHRHHQQSF